MSESPVVCLALPFLFDAVVARFKLDSTSVEQDFGWRTPQKHKTVKARIQWVPGDPGGSLGSLDAPVKTGNVDERRSLATLRELFTVYIGANEPQMPEDERAQYRAARLLYDAWLRAVYLSAHGTFRIVSQDWNTEKNERRHGAEIVCVCWIEAVVPDQTYDLAPPDTEAEIVTSLDDVDETTTTATP